MKTKIFLSVLIFLMISCKVTEDNHLGDKRVLGILQEVTVKKVKYCVC